MIKLYGIPNCDTVKKARSWLAENGIEFEFVDFKKNALTAELIDGWLEQAALEILLNKRGTTWRKLDKDEQESAATKEGAIALMVENPSIIKRPVLVKEGQVHVGFSVEAYQEIFG